MIKIQTDSLRWTQDMTGGWLCIKCSHPRQVLDQIEEGKTYDVEIKLHRNRRSLDANAYCWVLLDKLADKLSYGDKPITKEELYRAMIPEIPGISETVCVKDEAVDTLVQGWQHNGLGWLTRTMPSKLPGCTNVILYTGSSAFDTRQMSMLLDLVIYECELQHIDTATPEELARLEGYDAQMRR